MKTKIGLLLIVFVVAIANLNAQDVTTVEATDSNISENLDLEAVASVFGESEDLEDFEKRLNDPDTQISNLDLNEDGEVDYLRVIESSKDETHLVTIQAVIAKDKYQDVAVIDVEKDSEGETQVQVVGDVYMYGPDYIITPVYVHPPAVVVWFWGPYYNPWRSPYYYGYYPPYYRPWRPYPTPRYRTNVHVHVNVNNSYNRTTVRKSRTSVELQNKSRKNDFGSKNPDKSYSKRNEGSKNKQDLNNKKGTEKVNNTKTENSKESTGKKVQDDWKTASEKKGTKSNVKDNKTSVPSNKSNAKPANKSVNKPATRPANKPSGKSKGGGKRR
ncbi:MAG: hypothetical protein DRI72_01195 [Bacteroidetes bacterium]|nr:MAG: hypothetical protein DRI72_01195 [Bacteroidota bacterium]